MSEPPKAASASPAKPSVPNAVPFTDGLWEAEGMSIVVHGRGLIATCPTPGRGGTMECVANASLIAAAPELYEAARLFVEEYDAADHDEGVALMLAYNRALEAAKAALAKARGEQ